LGHSYTPSLSLSISTAQKPLKTKESGIEGAFQALPSLFKEREEALEPLPKPTLLQRQSSAEDMEKFALEHWEKGETLSAWESLDVIAANLQAAESSLQHVDGRQTILVTSRSSRLSSQFCNFLLNLQPSSEQTSGQKVEESVEKRVAAASPQAVASASPAAFPGHSQRQPSAASFLFAQLPSINAFPVASRKKHFGSSPVLRELQEQVLCDFPSLLEDRGFEIDVSALSNCFHILRNCSSFKLVIVCSLSELELQPSQFVLRLQTLFTQFKGTSGAEKLLSSLIIAVSEMPKSLSLQQLREDFAEETDDFGKKIAQRLFCFSSSVREATAKEVGKEQTAAAIVTTASATTASTEAHLRYKQAELGEGHAEGLTRSQWLEMLRQTEAAGPIAFQSHLRFPGVDLATLLRHLEKMVETMFDALQSSSWTMLSVQLQMLEMLRGVCCVSLESCVAFVSHLIVTHLNRLLLQMRIHAHLEQFASAQQLLAEAENLEEELQSHFESPRDLEEERQFLQDAAQMAQTRWGERLNVDSDELPDLSGAESFQVEGADRLQLLLLYLGEHTFRHEKLLVELLQAQESAEERLEQLKANVMDGIDAISSWQLAQRNVALSEKLRNEVFAVDGASKQLEQLLQRKQSQVVKQRVKDQETLRSLQEELEAQQRLQRATLCELLLHQEMDSHGLSGGAFSPASIRSLGGGASSPPSLKASAPSSRSHHSHRSSNEDVLSALGLQKPVKERSKSIIAIPQKRAFSFFNRAREPQALGKSDWEWFFGDPEEAPPLPEDIQETLQAPCPIWPGRSVQETHALVLLPSSLSREPLTLNRLEDLIQQPLNGENRTQLRAYSETARNVAGVERQIQSVWVLITKDVLPESRGKNYAAQLQMINQLSREMRCKYSLPSALQLSSYLLLHHAKTGQKLLSDEPLTYSRCLRKGKKQWPMAVGGFTEDGLHIASCYDPHSRYDFCGIVAMRKLS